jgi:hypothetical protein
LAESLALAALEQFVHIPKAAAGMKFMSFKVEIPAEVKIAKLDVAALPANWRAEPVPKETMAMGDAWIKGRHHPGGIHLRSEPPPSGVQKDQDSTAPFIQLRTPDVEVLTFSREYPYSILPPIFTSTIFQLQQFPEFFRGHDGSFVSFGNRVNTTQEIDIFPQNGFSLIEVNVILEADPHPSTDSDGNTVHLHLRIADSRQTPITPIR